MIFDRQWRPNAESKGCKQNKYTSLKVEFIYFFQRHTWSVASTVDADFALNKIN